MTDKDRYDIRIKSPDIQPYRSRDDPFHPTTAGNTEAGIIWVVLVVSIMSWLFWVGVF